MVNVVEQTGDYRQTENAIATFVGQMERYDGH